ncbi:MAG: hypothetical protein HY403_03540 [Elusimicrobia bacterium]|nr:hypothetical protein [Elusimicrobiota bacterium]
MRLLALALALVPAAASAMPAGFPEAVRRESVRALAQMDGFEENKAWLAKAGIHIEKDISKSLIAQYEEPGVGGGTGRILVSQEALERSWRSLQAQGVDDASAARLAGWMLVPSLVHEAQHAIQVHAMSRVDFGFYAVEMEVEAEAVGMTAYLQILSRFPELGHRSFFIKSQNNASLMTWRKSFAAFRDDIRQSYPRVPVALDGGVDNHLLSGKGFQQGIIDDVDERLESEPLDRSDLDRRKMEAESALRELRDPARREALLDFYRGLAASAERLWTVWDHLDPSRRLKRSPALNPGEAALTSLAAARGLAAVSPVYHEREILQHLQAAKRAATDSGNPALSRQVQGQLRDFKTSLPAYARTVILSNAATAQDSVKLETDLNEYLKDLRAKLTPAQYREAEELVREAIRKVRRAPPAP